MHFVACIKLFKIRPSCEKGDLPTPYALNCNKLIFNVV